MTIHTLNSRMMESHMYVVEEGGAAILIDCADAPRVMEYMDARGWSPDYVILTHEHCDHSYGVDEIREHFHCRVYASETCDRNLRDSRKNFSRYYRALVALQQRLPTDGQMDIEPFVTHADDTFSGELQLAWRGHQLQLVETPGHSQGSICILLDERMLFSGDSYFWKDDVVTSFEGGSRSDYENHTLPWINGLSSDIVVYPGHYESFRLGDRA